MVLDMVRGKSAVIRMIFTFMDELDVMEGNLVRTRRARPVRIPEWAEADDGDETASLDEQGLGEETPLPMWGEFASEVPSSGMKTESPPAAADKGARPLLRGTSRELKQNRSGSSSRCRAGCRARRSCGGAKSRPRWSAGGRLMNRLAPRSRLSPRNMATSFRERAPRSRSKMLRFPSLRGDRREYKFAPRRGPYKRALRERFERLAAAEREEAARKAAKAESLLMLRQAQHEDNLPRPEPGPPVQPGKGGPTRETPNHCRTSPSGCADSRRRREALIWKRGYD